MSTLEFPPPEPPRNVYDMAPADCVTVGTAAVSIWIRVSKLLIDLDCRKMWTLLQNLRPSTSSLGHLVSFRRYVVFIHYPLVIRCKNQICIARLDPENFVRLAVIGKKSRFFFLRRRMSSNDPDAGSEESTGQHETRDQSAIKRLAQPYKRDTYPYYTNQEEREQEREREHTANGRYKKKNLKVQSHPH